MRPAGRKKGETSQESAVCGFVCVFFSRREKKLEVGELCVLVHISWELGGRPNGLLRATVHLSGVDQFQYCFWWANEQETGIALPLAPVTDVNEIVSATKSRRARYLHGKELLGILTLVFFPPRPSDNKSFCSPTEW